MAGNGIKKLRKLPHVFGKVLELPFRSDADVEVEENPKFFRFVTEIGMHGNVNSAIDISNVRAEAVEIHPGVTKIVVRNGAKGGEAELLLEQLKVDTWRFRLPATAKPELAMAAFTDGELIVTVPKGGNGRGGFGGRDNVLVRRREKGRGKREPIIIGQEAQDSFPIPYCIHGKCKDYKFRAQQSCFPLHA